MENKKNKGKIPLVVYFIFFFGMLIVLNMFRTSYNVKEITYSEFKDMIDAKQIEKITIKTTWRTSTRLHRLRNISKIVSALLWWAG